MPRSNISPCFAACSFGIPEKESVNQMLAIKVYRINEGTHLYVLYGTVAPDKSVTYAGGGIGGPWKNVLDRVATVPTATKVTLRLHDGMQKEPVWRVNVEEHDALVAQLMKDSPKRIVEVVPRAVLDVFHNKPPLATIRPDYKTQLELFPYQKGGVEFIVRHHGRGIIADEMVSDVRSLLCSLIVVCEQGLGKTYQGLGVLEYYNTERPALILCPASVKASWSDHVSTLFPGERLRHIQSGKDEFEPQGINILSYGMLSSPTFQAKMDAFRPKILIVDESHYVKNSSAARTKRVFKWSKVAQRVVLLSGTLMNRPHELYSQVKCIDRNLFKNYFHFQKHLPTHGLVTSQRAPATFYFASRYCAPELKEVRGHSTFNFKHAENESELHAILKERVMIRRTKKEVLPQLPPLIREKVTLDAWEQPGKLEGLDVNDKDFMELVRETSKHKLPAVLTYLKEIVSEELENDPSLKVLLWSHFHEFTDAIAEALPNTVVMDGRVSTKARADRVRAFQTDPNVRVAVLGISAMSTGVNLTAATLEIFCELCFSPDVLLQCEARASRIGQEYPVYVRYLCSGESTDSVIWRMLGTKIKNSANIIDGGVDVADWKKTKTIRTTRPEEEPAAKKPCL